MNIGRMVVIKKQKSHPTSGGTAFCINSELLIQILQYLFAHRAHFVMKYSN
jgi:hypothetical protein